MASTTQDRPPPEPPPLMRHTLGPFAFRPRLMGSVLAGLVAFGVLSLLGQPHHWTLRAILGWDITCTCFVALVLAEMRKETVAELKAKCAQQDEGQGLILGVVLIAVATSLIAVGLELSAAKDTGGLVKGLRVGVAGATVALSWMTVQIVFALHYAHQYYAPDESTPEEDDVIGGLQFPGGQEPDYWDFLHFAVVIGVASQTADVAFTRKRMRHIGTVHGLIAFVFNTLVLALAINLLAGLF